jgi:hypothetical protein
MGNARPPRSAEWCANISKAKTGKTRVRRKIACKYGHDMTKIGARNKYGQCVECLHVYMRTYKKEYHNKNKSEIAVVNREKRYGVSIFDYAEMMAKQDGKCALCGGGPRGRRVDLDVDHDHVTGKVRGLLCNPCNVFLGRVESNPELLERIQEYLEEHRDTSVVNS